MSKKDYILLANALNKACHEIPSDETAASKAKRSIFERTYAAISNALQDDNPYFKRGKFHDAVYKEA